MGKKRNRRTPKGQKHFVLTPDIEQGVTFETEKSQLEPEYFEPIQEEIIEQKLSEKYI